MQEHQSPDLAVAVRDGVARAIAGVALAGIAVIHLLDLPGKFSEVPYMGWMYIGLIAASLATAFALVRTSDARIWKLAVLLPAAAIVGFVLTRTVGLPQATDDIGNWAEPLGMASLLVEGSLVALGAAVLADRQRAAVKPVRQDAWRGAHPSSSRA
jgi:hypothetical protein